MQQVTITFRLWGKRGGNGIEGDGWATVHGVTRVGQNIATNHHHQGLGS